MFWHGLAFVMVAAGLSLIGWQLLSEKHFKGDDSRGLVVVFVGLVLVVVGLVIGGVAFAVEVS